MVPKALIGLIVLILLCGCRQTGQEPEGSSLGGGRVEATFSRPIPALADQAREVLLEQNLVLSQYSADARAGRIIAYTRDGNRVEMDLRPDAKGSRLSITSAGNSGDQTSMELLRAIQARK